MEYFRSLFTIQPGRSDWVGGLRLAIAFALPVAIAIAFGGPEVGLFLAIGAFFTANADLGFNTKITMLGMGTSTLIVPIACALGMAVGGDSILAVIIGFIVLAAGGLASAAGPTAAVHGVFASFAYLIGIGLAASDASIIDVCAALLVGGLYAVGLSWGLRRLGIDAFPPPPDLPPGHAPGQALRSELSGWTPTTRRALALGIVGGIGLIFVPFVQDSNGAWLITAGLIVLKPDIRSTVDAATARGLGTVAGAVVAGLLAALTSNAWFLLITAFLLTWWAEALIRRSYGAFSMLITPLAVLLANIVLPGDWHGAILRAADVAIGSVLGVLVGFLLLPRTSPAEETDVSTSHAEADAAP